MGITSNCGFFGRASHHLVCDVCLKEGIGMLHQYDYPWSGTTFNAVKIGKYNPKYFVYCRNHSDKEIDAKIKSNLAKMNKMPP